MTINIMPNTFSISENEIKIAVDYLSKRLAYERELINKGYAHGDAKLFVVGGGFSSHNENGILLHRDEAYEVLKAFKSAGYHTWIQWSPNQHYMRAIVVSCVDRNDLSPHYYEEY